MSGYVVLCGIVGLCCGVIGMTLGFCFRDHLERKISGWVAGADEE